VVMIPDNSMVPVYYSKRHIIRGVVNDSIVDKIVGQSLGVFPESPVYLALHPEGLQYFSQALQSLDIVKTSPDLVLLKLPMMYTPERCSALVNRRVSAPLPALMAGPLKSPHPCQD
jgi:hypothetical protein